MNSNGTVCLSALDDNLLRSCIEYLHFSDVIKIISKLNKRMYSLSQNTLYGITNYPITHETCTSISLILSYVKYLTKNKNFQSFGYRIKRLDWSHCEHLLTNGGTDTDKLLLLTILFGHLKRLQYLKFGGAGFDFLNNLPIQTQLTHLMLECSDNDDGIEANEMFPGQWSEMQIPKLNICSFLRNKIDINSLYLLKEFSVSQFVITAELLQILSKMTHLEIFKIEQILYDIDQWDDGKIDEKLIRNAFLNWQKLSELTIYTKASIWFAGYSSTFHDHPFNDIILQTLLSIQSLKSLTFSVYLWDEMYRFPNSCDISRIYPYFRNLNSLNCLHFYLFENNILMMTEIIKILKNKSLLMETIKINAGCEALFDYLSDTEKTEEFKSLIFECLSITEKHFRIELPSKIMYESFSFMESNNKFESSTSIKYLKSFCELIEQYNQKYERYTKLKELFVEIYCDGMKWSDFLLIHTKISHSFHALSANVSIQLIGNSFATRPNHEWKHNLDGTQFDCSYSMDEYNMWNDLQIHPKWRKLEIKLKESGFRLNCSINTQTDAVHIESLNCN